MYESDSAKRVNLIQDLLSDSSGGLEMAFGDIRVACRAEWLIDRVAATGSLVLRKLGGDIAGERAVGRFLASPPCIGGRDRSDACGTHG